MEAPAWLPRIIETVEQRLHRSAGGGWVDLSLPSVLDQIEPGLSIDIGGRSDGVRPPGEDRICVERHIKCPRRALAVYSSCL